MIASRRPAWIGVTIAVLMFSGGADWLGAEEPALRMHASLLGSATVAPLTIELMRWSADAERAPLLAALAAPPPASSATPPAEAAAGRGARGGRGGRGAAPPPSPLARLTAAVKAAPTVGFIWGDGPTGYSIKYSWRAASPAGRARVVLVTDRRLGAHLTSDPPVASVASDAEFTVIEIQMDGKGSGEGKTSLTTGVVVDATAGTLALESYAAAPVLLKVTR